MGVDPSFGWEDEEKYSELFMLLPRLTDPHGVLEYLVYKHLQRVNAALLNSER